MAFDLCASTEKSVTRLMKYHVETQYAADGYSTEAAYLWDDQNRLIANYCVKQLPCLPSDTLGQFV